MQVGRLWTQAMAVAWPRQGVGRESSPQGSESAAERLKKRLILGRRHFKNAF
jgi:hypothetical protein